ncbi:MAG: PKD domain-containing protein [Bacteroidetes bacterium]|nr:PKD domain-containing protein [Bacteroidota bacterium]
MDNRINITRRGPMYKIFFLFTGWLICLSGHAQHYRLISPKQDYVFSDATINFRWNNVDSAVTYDIQIAQDAGFGNLVQSQTGISGTNVQITLALGTTYFWHVRASTPSGSQSWSYSRSFSIYRPTNFPGLAAWFDAEKNVVSSANKVSSWTDISPASLTAAQPTANKQPTFVSGIAQLNSKPVLRFSGSSSTGSTLNFTSISLTDFTIFMVRNYASNSNLIQYVLGGTKSGICAAASYYTAGYGVYSNLTSTDALYAANTASLNTAYSIYSYQKNRLARNGIQPPLALSKQIPGINFSAIGTRPDATSFAFQGDIAEIIVYSNAIDSTGINNIEGYLRFKYSKHVDLGADTILNSFCVSVPIPATPGFSSYLWSTGATTSSITATKFGKYWVRATDIFGYVSSDTMEIRPQIVFNQLPKNIGLCQGDSIEWNTGYPSSGFQFTWSTGATTPSIIIKNPGTYSVRIKDAGNCTLNSDTAKVAIDNFPNYTVGADTSFCSGNRLNFGYTNSLTSILWSNGDTTQTPAIFSSGNYSVAAINSNSCRAWDTLHVNIKGLAPNANFSFQGICLSDTSRFMDLSQTVPTDPISSWKWTFGNVGASILQNPKIVFDSLKTYPITLLITTDSGCTDGITKSATIGSIPTADFAYPPIQCLGGLAKFTDNSSVLITDTIIQWQWIFNQTDTLQGQTPEYSFPHKGIIPVTLKVTTTRGCEHTAFRSVSVFNELIADFKYSGICDGDSTSFTDITSSYSVVRWQWNFGDGSFLSALKNPKHKFTIPDSYVVNFTVENAIGCVDTVQKNVQIIRKPTASFSKISSCVNARYTPLQNSLSPTEPISQWQWNINGSSYNKPAPNHVFKDSGTYSIKLIVTTQSGCKDSITKLVSVTPNPVAAFGYTPLYGEAPLDVNFSNKSTKANTYSWDFGDGSPSSALVNPSHTYEDNDTFRIVLHAYSGSGCVDSAAKTYIVVPTLLDLSVDDVQTKTEPQTDGSVLVTVTASMSNLGTRLITDVRLFASLGTGGIITEDWAGALTTGQRMDYIFKARFVLSPDAINNTYVCVEARNVNKDEPETRTDNNRQCHSVNGVIQLVGPFPNPSRENSRLGLILPKAGIVTINITDLYGRFIIQEEMLTLPGGRSDYALPIGQLRAATYFIHVSYLDELRVIKFVVR